MSIDRRHFLLGGTAAGVAGIASGKIHDGELGAPEQVVHGSVPWQEGAADSPPGVSGTGYSYFTKPEAEFIEAALACLIPSDPVGPGAVEANVPFFIDRQLIGPYGRGDHLYKRGPWSKGTPEQGYQSRFTPAELYRAGIAAVDQHVVVEFHGRSFAQVSPTDQHEVLKGLEAGTITLDRGVDAQTFFSMLLQNTKEGYFADPIYGGNKDMAAWKMIGFPGAHYDYKEWVSRHGERVPYPPVSFMGRPGWRSA
jgi:gluconate 2-dehydrogenase gamma chain